MNKIFHFTSFESLECIISDNSFRVSSVNFMNDIEEFENMQQIKDKEFYETKNNVKRKSENICLELFGEGFWDEKCSNIAEESLEKTHKSIKRLNELKECCYIGSFSEIPDEYKDREYEYIANISSMWSHYAKKYNGVCIVFNQDKLNKLFNKTLKGNCYKLLKEKVKYKYFYDYNFSDKKSDIDILREKYFVKNYSWNIENEFRYLFYNKSTKIRKKDKYLYFKGIISCIDAIIISTNINSENISNYESIFKKIMDNRIKVYQLFRNYNSNSIRAAECDY